MPARTNRLVALLLLLLSACDCESSPSLDAAVIDAATSDGATSDAHLGTPEVCDNVIDDDLDGAIDCDDVDCMAQDMVAAIGVTRDVPFVDRVRFLWEGGVCPPLQVDAALASLERRDIAAIHGRVADEGGGVLAGVRVDVLNHPELGRTETRLDGEFDLAVVPGEELVVRFAVDGYIDAQRTVRSYPGTYASTLNLEMLRAAPSTMVDLGAGAVVRSDISEDADGTRSATLLFPAGTSAEIRGSDGTMTPATSLRIGPREFTVGQRGPERMVSTLPPTSAYTYAIELGVNDGEDVFFDRPVPVYVTDFLGMPVGTPVPVGSYDRQRGQWVPEADGLVVEITSTSGGLASLDVDGDGLADDLAPLGIEDEERRGLASEHEAGTRLWRFAPTHFSAWDLNWPFAFPADGILPALASLIGADEFLQDSCVPGSQIRVQRQILGEQIGVVGTGMALHYSSDRHPAYEVSRRIRQQITPEEIPASLLEVRVELDVAGQEHRQSFRPGPGLVFEHTWDGLDRYGRAFRGPAHYLLRVGYVYNGDYTSAGSEDAGLGPDFGRGGSRITGSQTREEIVAWQDTHGVVRLNDVLPDGLHGLSLSAHHRYEPLAEILVLGDGSTMRGAGVPRIIERVAGGGSSPSPEVGDAALSRRFNNLAGVAVGPGGRVHFSERRTHRIWRVEEDGTLGLVAGTGIAGMSGDGGPALEAEITRPGNLAFGPSGDLYFTSPAVAASPSTRVIRRIDGAGVIHRVAGNGERGDAANAEGDGLDALDAPLEEPREVSFGPDGTLYFVDGLSTLRMIDTAGRLRTLNPRSTRQSFLDEDSTPLSQADFGAIGAFAVDRLGTLFVGNLEGVVFRIGADRRIFRIAGGGEAEFDRALGPNLALTVDLGVIRALAPSTDGGLWLVDRRSRVMRLVGGRLTFVSGASDAWPSGDGGPAAAATLTSVAQLSVDTEARLVIAEGFPADQIRRIRAGFGSRRGDEWVIPSSDGTLRYIFDVEGRHLRSETSLTGALVHQFDYDDAGRLRTIMDADENVIVIERSGDDIIIRPTQGPATRLIDEDGDQYVDRVVTDGDEHEARFDWRDAGQLVGFTDRIGVVHEFDYDSLGRLTLDGIVGGATQRIEREGRSVTLTTGGGRAATWGGDGSTGERIQSYTNAAGVSMERSTSDEGVQTTRYEDGSEIAVVLRPDELLGAGVSVPVSTIVRTPSGRQVEWALEQDSTITDGVLDERVTRIITGVGTPREALTRQRLAITADGGSVFEMTSAEGRQGTMVRNAGGELVAITQPGRFPVRLEYDEHGRLVRALQGPEGRPDEARVLSWALPTIPSESFGDVEVEDATGRSVRASFDGRGRADEVSDEVGAAAFGFDEAARSLTVTPPGRDAHEFNFDSRGFMSAYAPPGVGGSATEGRETFEFDDDGIPLAMNFAGSEVSVDVDDSFRGRGASFGEGLFSAVDFDESGDVSARRWVQPGGEVRVEPSYDGPLVTSVTIRGAVSATFTPEYDSTLELIATEIGAGGETGSVSWTRDDDGLTNAMTMTTSSINSIPMTLDPRSGDLTAMRSGGADSMYDIDGFGSLEGAQHAWPGGSLSFGYSRDRAGRIEDITESGRADQSFDFDARGRLTSALEGGVERHGYDYDANGNRIGWRLPAMLGGTCEGAACTEYDEQDRLLLYGNGAAQVTYRYNGAGMRIERTDRSGTTRYDYDSLGHLNGVTLPSGEEVSYLHDPSGSRTTRSVGGTRTAAWLQAGGRISAQLDASGALEVLYAYVTKDWVPDWALHRDGRLFRVITDHVGSVRLVVDADTGDVAQQYRYSPYGVLEEDITSEAIVPHRFAGGHYDEATGLLRFGARDYDPQVGRWTNKDPLGFAAGDTNLYAYVSGDPVNGVDPSGLFVDTLTDGIAVAGCLFALARDNIYGSCDNLGSNLGNCAIAAAAFVLPFVSYGMLGLGQRLGRRTARAPDIPCGAGLCPCFVAGTLVATMAMSSVAGADFDAYVDSNAPIESLQVGQRVLTALSDNEVDDTEVTSDWQVIDLELGDDDGQVLLTVLRPPEWLTAMDPDGDGAFELELPELRLQGIAHVIQARGPPAIVDAPGRVVLSTVEHRVESVLALTFDDASEVVTTPNHPFYSVSRGWTAAGELQFGEAVETRDGERTLASAEYRNAPQSVFNLEVEGDHEYLVGESGLRVHNVCGLPAPLPAFANRATAVRHYAKHARGVVARSRGRLTPKRGGADMPEYRSFTEYHDAARAFHSGSPGRGVLEGVRANGDSIRFEPASGLFGVRSSDGVIRTFFRPDGNASQQAQYFADQF